MHIHLDPVGGAAGDMFAAAMLDAFPEWAQPLVASFHAAGLDRIATIAHHKHSDGILDGSRFQVDPAQVDLSRVDQASHAHSHSHSHSHNHVDGPGHDHHDEESHAGHDHRHIDDIRALIDRSELSPSVKAIAHDIFGHLAIAESEVHGMPISEVTFHEVGAWDSIADVISAAWLIDRAGATSWSCGTLPLGRGRTAAGDHGVLPVPAPATAVLLKGYPMAHMDEVRGERITPTGAAILRHLDPSFSGLGQGGILRGIGMGFGTARFQGISNVLRVLVFDDLQPVGTVADQSGATQSGPIRSAITEDVAECRFEVDDQTPEDLAVGLQNLRELPGVLDVVQSTVFGKKGRIAAQVQVLSRPESVDDVVDACLSETTTLGVRWSLVQRAVLPRTEAAAEADGQRVRLKAAHRPGGVVTVKAEMDDIAASTLTAAGRSALRQQAELNYDSESDS